VQKYGDKILEAIQRYCEQNDIEPQEDATENTAPKKGETHLISFQLFKEGLTIPEISKKRGLVIGTIESHLIKFVNAGKLKVTDLMSKEKYLELKKLIKDIPFESIRELKNKIDDKFTYNEIRMINRENADR